MHGGHFRIKTTTGREDTYPPAYNMHHSFTLFANRTTSSSRKQSVASADRR